MAQFPTLSAQHHNLFVFSTFVSLIYAFLKAGKKKKKSVMSIMKDPSLFITHFQHSWLSHLWNMLLIIFVIFGILGPWAAKLKPANFRSSIQSKSQQIIFFHIPELRYHSLNIHRTNATIWDRFYAKSH